jgi:hypothetical protein
VRIHVRKALAGLLAVCLAASGLTWQSCLAGQAAAIASPVVAPAQDLAQHHHADHKAHHNQQNDISSSTAPDQHQSDDHGCMKCCSLCVVSGVAPSVLSVKAIFVMSLVAFSYKQEQYAGHSIQVDPGIPKRIT